jgi:PAS domain S-box-containing protein
MTLHRQTTWFMLVAAAAVLVCLSITLYASTLVRAEAVQAARAEAVARAVSQFRYLAIEAALYQQDRTNVQWRRRVNSFRGALDELSSGTPAALSLQARERSNVDVIDRLYTTLTAPGVAPLLVAGAERDTAAPVIGALLLTTQLMTDDAFALARISREALDRSHYQLLALMLINVIMLGGLIALGSVAIRWRVLRPIDALKSAMEAVGAGNLAARAGVSASNELGYLARAFDSMTGQLERSGALTATEIAARRQAQHSLEESVTALHRARADLQAILDHTPALVVYWDRDLINQFANRAALDWLGMTPEAMRGRSMLDLVGKKRFASHEPRLVDVLLGRPALFEAQVVTPDGSVRQALFSYIPDMVGAEVKGFYGFVSDISALRQAEAGQAAALARLRGVVDAARDVAIILTGLDGTIELFSAGAERMLGYRADELVGPSTPALLHDGQELAARGASGALEGPYDAVVQQVRGGGSETQAWTFCRKDGSRLPVSLTVSAVTGADGAAIGFLGLARDIGPEQRRQQDLIAARDAAQAASRTKSDFLANMSHEIRTPMNAVIGMLQLLTYTELDKVQRDYAGKSLVAARSLLTLLNDILDLSRIEADGLTLDIHPFEPAQLAAELSGVLGGLIGDRNLDLLISIDPALPSRLCGDALRLRQVLINLAGNAIKFTPAGRVSIAIGRAENGDIAFTVRDTGIGIAAEQIEAIFAPFSQAEASTTRRFGGTGLGLAISQRLVGLMGGQLHVTSVPGAGSVFDFTLPLLPPATALHDRPATALHDSEQRASKVVGLPLAGLHILLVDDNALNLQVARELLIMRGATITVADGGQPAVQLALAADASFDAILMDVQMPDMDGYAACRAIRASAAPSGRVPVLAMTANAMQGDREKSLAAGMNEHLTKPMDLAQVVSALLLHCGRQPAPALPVRQAPADGAGAGAGARIDYDGAMRRIGGNAAVYFSASEGFASQSAALLPQLRSMFALAHWPAAADLLHIYKSSAGMVGADALHQLAARLEHALRRAPDELDCVAALDALAAAVDDIVQELQLLEQANRPLPAPAPPAAPLAELPPMLDELETLLSQSNMRAGALFATLQANFGAQLGERLHPLADAMSRLDFKTAVTCGRALRKDLI